MGKHSEEATTFMVLHKSLSFGSFCFFSVSSSLSAGRWLEGTDPKTHTHTYTLKLDKPTQESLISPFEIRRNFGKIHPKHRPLRWSKNPSLNKEFSLNWGVSACQKPRILGPQNPPYAMFNSIWEPDLGQNSFFFRAYWKHWVCRTRVPRPSGPEIPQKSQKGPECQKKCRKSANGPEKRAKRSQHQCSGSFPTLFWLESGQEGPGRPVWDFLLLGICPLARKLLWIFSSNLPGNFALKNGGDFFGEIFLVSIRFPQTKH